MRDEFTEWQDYAKRGQLLKEDGTSSGQPHETALTISWNAWEARSKLTKPLGREQRRAMIEAAINDCDEEERIKAQDQVAAKVSHITLPDFSDVATANPKPGPMVLMEKVERVTSATRTALNEHLDTLTDAELERVLRFCQSRYPLQAKAT